ncbi:MAG TPA: hypothetical protein GX515_00400 [Firmicutes bacterium]|nr:hypothetical protein [Bacillota bacterium]
MLIESLVRLGRPLVKGGLSPAEVLKQISDVASENARNFFAHVFVVEIKRDGSPIASSPVSHCCIARALAMQQWGSYGASRGAKGKKNVFVQDIGRGVGAPFVLPKGGNPRTPQGKYGVPVYPIYDGDIKAFNESPTCEGVKAFLAGRLERTIGFALSSDELENVALELHRAIRAASLDPSEKALGVVVLAELTDDGPFGLADAIVVGDPSMSYVGPSMIAAGKHIVARLEKVLERFWEAKIDEATEGGEECGSDSKCFFCDASGRVVSAYCKAWPWLLPTWNCPFPISWAEGKSGLNNANMVKGIAVCPECYKALSYGANVFMKLSSSFDTWLTKEIFSPVASATGKDMAKRAARIDPIQGSVVALPILDEFLSDEDARDEFVEGITRMLARHHDARRLDVHLKAITGFEMVLPEEFSREEYRLYLTYFTGNPSRGDVHLRATIEDVLPSTARQVTKLVSGLGEYAVDIARRLRGKNMDEQQEAFVRHTYTSLPYLLGTAFGAPFLWDSLNTTMHRGNIASERFLANSAARMSELGHQLPDSYARLNDEIVFYLTFRRFLQEYNREIRSEKGGEQMRDWKEIHAMLSGGRPEDMVFRDAEELGFACGHLTGLFSRQYWHATKVGREGKDFLKHRVMTFGTDLTPTVVYERGLARMEEVARRLDMHLPEDFRRRLAVVLVEFARTKDEIARNRHAFMAAFWAGHNLAGSQVATEHHDDSAER